MIWHVFLELGVIEDITFSIYIFNKSNWILMFISFQMFPKYFTFPTSSISPLVFKYLLQSFSDPKVKSTSCAINLSCFFLRIGLFGPFLELKIQALAFPKMRHFQIVWKYLI